VEQARSANELSGLTERIPDAMAKPEKRDDGYYHNGKKIVELVTQNPRGETTMVKTVDHDTGTLRMKYHINHGDNGTLRGNWRTFWVYEDGTTSEDDQP
jgi:hypothetical protein